MQAELVDAVFDALQDVREDGIEAGEIQWQYERCIGVAMGTLRKEEHTAAWKAAMEGMCERKDWVMG